MIHHTLYCVWHIYFHRIQKWSIVHYIVCDIYNSIKFKNDPSYIYCVWPICVSCRDAIASKNVWNDNVHFTKFCVRLYKLTNFIILHGNSMVKNVVIHRMLVLTGAEMCQYGGPRYQLICDCGVGNTLQVVGLGEGSVGKTFDSFSCT